MRSCDTSGMTQQEYDAIKRKLKEDFRSDLRSLQRIYDLSKSIAQPTIPPSPLDTNTTSVQASYPAPEPLTEGQETPESDDANSKLDVVGLVKEVLRNFGTEEFTSSDVYQRLVEVYPNAAPHLKRASVTSAMNRLEDQGELDLVMAGAGKRPSLFKKTVAW